MNIKKICSILILIMLLLNSSVLTIISTAVDVVQNQIVQTSTGAQEKISMDLSYTQLTNRAQNELIITGVLEKDSEGKVLYDNPTIYFEMPKEVEKVVIKDVKVLYDDELSLKEYIVEKNEEGNQVIRVSLEGKQTQSTIDGLTKGTNIRILANIILKQDIQNTETSIKMTCGEFTCEKKVNLVTTTEKASINENEEIIDENAVYTNGLQISTIARLGDNELTSADTIHSNEIIKYEIKIKNTTSQKIENVKVKGHVPENATFVDFDEEAFDYWNYTYTNLTDSLETNEEGVTALWQDDTLQYIADENKKTEEIDVGALEAGEIKTYYYEVRINKVSEDVQSINSEIEYLLNEQSIYTYKMENKVENATTEIRIRTYISRSQRNQFADNIIVKNISDQEQNIKVYVNNVENLEKIEVNNLANYDGELNYTLEDGNLVVEFKNVKAGDYKSFQIKEKMTGITEEDGIKYQIKYSAIAEDTNGNKYASNQSIINGGIEAVEITQTSEKNGETLKYGDEITYNFEIENTGYVREEEGGYSEVTFAAVVPKELLITFVSWDTNTVERDDKTKEYKLTPVRQWFVTQKLNEINAKSYDEFFRVTFRTIIKVGEKAQVQIKAKVREQEVGKDIELECAGSAGTSSSKMKISNIISNTIYNAKKTNQYDENGNEVPDNSNGNGEETPGKEENPNVVPETKKYNISGTAWIDENENGERDDTEKLKSGVKVQLYNIEAKDFVRDSKGKILEITTDKEGKYSFKEIATGKYYVVFEYNTNDYTITDYQKTGVHSSVNNDAIEKVANVMGEVKTIGITNTIDLTSDNKNIDIGLKENKIFDLKIEQFVQKITVTNSKGTKEYNYNNSKLAKVEIHSKEFKGSTVVIEYNIKVTNIGELAGNVYEIINQIPEGLDFHSELNTGWSKTASYKISNALYTTKEIKPGESIELTVTLSKTLNNNSAGSYKSIASIGMTDNSRHIEDSNTENNTSEVEVLITVATGLQIAFRIIGSILATLVLALIIFIIIKKSNKNVLKITLMLVVLVSVSTIILKDLTIRSQAGPISDAIDAYQDWANEFNKNNGGGSSGGGSSGEGSGEGSGGDDYGIGSVVDEKMAELRASGNYTEEELASMRSALEADADALTNSLKEQGVPTEYGPQIQDQLRSQLSDAIPKQEIYMAEDNLGSISSGKGNGHLQGNGGYDNFHCISEDAAQDHKANAKEEYIYDLTDVRISNDVTLNKDGTITITTGTTGTYQAEGKGWCDRELQDAQGSNIDSFTITPPPGVAPEEVVEYYEGYFEYEQVEPTKVVIVKLDENAEKNLYEVDENGNYTSEFEFRISKVANDAIYEAARENMNKYITIQGELHKITEIEETIANLKKSGGLANIGGHYFTADTLQNIVDKAKAGIAAGESGTISGTSGGSQSTTGGNNSGLTPGGGSQIAPGGDNTQNYQGMSKEELEKILSGLNWNIGNLNNNNNNYSFEDILNNAGINLDEILDSINQNYGSNRLDVQFGSSSKEGLSDLGKTYKVGETITLEPGTYRIIEVKSEFGYDIYQNNEYGKYKEFYFTVTGQDILKTVRINNTAEFIKLSGNVWEDIGTGKDGSRNDLYKDSSEDSKDTPLEGVKVTLYKENTPIATKWTDENGHYEFGGRNADLTYALDTLKIIDIAKYHVEFEYNGMKYTNVVPNFEKDNGSKSIEAANVRDTFNRTFTAITSNTAKDTNGSSTGTAVGEGNSTTGTIYYRGNGSNQSKVIYGDNAIYNGTSFSGFKGDTNYETYGYGIYHIISSTEAAGYKLNEVFKYDKDNQAFKDKEIKNVNLGVYAREQVDLGLDSDVKQLDLSVNNYHHIYTYGTIVNPENPSAEEDVGVKLKALEGKYYERDLHESTIVYSATEAQEDDVYADITYKIYLRNKSSSLKAKINEITLNYDAKLVFQSYNYQGNNINRDATEQQNGDLKEITLDLSKLEGHKNIDPSSKDVLEVTFRASKAVIADILNSENGIKLDFMAEIKSYSTFSSDEAIYASIDVNSAPRNAQAIPTSTYKFVTDGFEDDTTIAPTFVLTKGRQTTISGIVFEDGPEKDKLDNNERVGDGIYNQDDEKVMANVKVELLKLNKQDGTTIGNSSEARENSNSAQTKYDMARLYRVKTNTANATEVGDAVTYTNEKGEYTFKGVVADDYVIRYTYGEDIKLERYVGLDGEYHEEKISINTSINDKNGNELKDIKAREYKSTIITSDYITTGIAVTNGVPLLNGNTSWFLNDKEEGNTRYSDAVDDVEYRAYLEENAKLNYDILKGEAKYIYSSIEAYTPYFKLGIEENDNPTENKITTPEQENYDIQTDGVGHLTYEFDLKNVDFGLIERPIVDLQVDKEITNVKLTLGNGQVPIDGNPSKDSLPYVKRLDDFVPIEMDTEIIQGATLKQEYTISVKNNSELDYPIYKATGDTEVAKSREYYYYGKVADGYNVKPVTAKIDVLADYVSSELDVDLEYMKNKGWEVMQVDNLTQYNSDDDNTYKLIADNVKEKLDKGNYKIFTTNAFAKENDSLVHIGESKSISYEVNRLLSSKDEMKYTNDVEILQYISYSQNKNKKENTYDRPNDTTPGNLVPERANEDDEDSVRTTITPPTGVIISKTLYTITALAGLIIVLTGAIWIKRKVL